MSEMTTQLLNIPAIPSLVEQFYEGMQDLLDASRRTGYEKLEAALSAQGVFLNEGFDDALISEMIDQAFDDRAVPIYPRYRALLTWETTAVFRVGRRLLRLIGQWDETPGRAPVFIPSEQWLDQTAARAISGWTADEWRDRLEKGSIPGLHRDPVTGLVPACQRPRVATRAFIEGIRSWIAS